MLLRSCDFSVAVNVWPETLTGHERFSKLSIKYRTFEMLCVRAKVWMQRLTATAEIELLLNMVWCFVVYCVQLPVCWIFCLPSLFQSFYLLQSIPVMDFQYWSCKSRESRSRSWTSKSWSSSWNCWVLVLVLDKQVLNPSLSKVIEVGIAIESPLMRLPVSD